MRRIILGLFVAVSTLIAQTQVGFEVADKKVHLRTTRGGMLVAWDMSMAEFGKQIEPTLHAPVVDATGLTKRYDFRLDYDSEMTNEPGDLPRLPVAVQQQLGLRLRLKKGPVEFLVINSVQKMPTEN
jgi:uncharacterized protein (TIGR03435 family)